MRALTIHQPYAGLIAAGVKLLENRPVRPPLKQIGERFAIHASMTNDEVGVEAVAAEGVSLVAHGGVARFGIRGAIVATARLIGYVQQGGVRLVAGAGIEPEEVEAVANRPDQLRWFTGPIGYVLADVRALTQPINARGMQGWWPVPLEIEARIREQEKTS